MENGNKECATVSEKPTVRIISKMDNLIEELKAVEDSLRVAVGRLGGQADDSPEKIGEMETSDLVEESFLFQTIRSLSALDSIILRIDSQIRRLNELV